LNETKSNPNHIKTVEGFLVYSKNVKGWNRRSTQAICDHNQLTEDEVRLAANASRKIRRVNGCKGEMWSLVEDYAKYAEE